MKSIAATTLMCGLLTASDAFVMPNGGISTTTTTTPTTRVFESAAPFDAGETAEEEEPYVNPVNPALPEVKGDFDWDAKFGGDDDWITENVPGKIVLDEISLSRQVTALNALEEKYRKNRQLKEIDDYQTVGWVGNAELMNSRFAMFFLAVGLFTESFTGVTIPGQVEEMLRILGFIGFD
jgi:hypothetical protein